MGSLFKRRSSAALVAVLAGSFLLMFQNCSDFSSLGFGGLTTARSGAGGSVHQVIGSSRNDLAQFPVDPSSQPYSEASQPLRYRPGRNLVVVGYYPWFGDRGQNKGGWRSKAVPALGAYSSQDTEVIDQHARWLEQLGADAILLDMSNGPKCTFSPDPDSACGDPATADTFRWIKESVAVVIERFAANGTRLKVIPLLGGAETNAFEINPATGRTYLEDQLAFFVELQQRFPSVFVLKDDKPFFTVFTGSQQDVDNGSAPTSQARVVLERHPEISGQRIAGYLGAQRHLWTGARSVDGVSFGEIDGERTRDYFWSWIERFRPDEGHVPSLALKRGSVESMTITGAAPPFDMPFGWNGTDSCYGDPERKTYWPHTTLNDHGQTWRRLMRTAKQVAPGFLLINQWNAFWQSCDHGFDAETIADLEPSSVTGYTAFLSARDEITSYRRLALAKEAYGAFDESVYLALYPDVAAAVSSGQFSSGQQHFEQYGRQEGRLSSFPEAGYLSCNKDVASAINDGWWHGSGRDHWLWFGRSENRPVFCGLSPAPSEHAYRGSFAREGFFRVVDQPAIYYSNGSLSFCAYPSWELFIAQGGRPDLSNVAILPSLPSTMQSDGACR